MTANPPQYDSLRPEEARLRLGVHLNTLQSWADRGVLRTFRTRGGHRRYATEDVDRISANRVALGLIPTLIGRGSGEFQKPVKPRRARDTKDSA